MFDWFQGRDKIESWVTQKGGMIAVSQKLPSRPVHTVA